MKIFSSIILTICLITGYGQIPENLPPLLMSPGGNSIQDASEWEANRGALISLFEEEVYGKIPAGINPTLRFSLLERSDNALGGKAIRKQVIITLSKPGNEDKLDLNLLLYLPAKSPKPVPVFVALNFFGNHTIHNDPAIFLTDNWIRNNESFGIRSNKATEISRGVRISRWPVEYILSRGYGLATLYYGDIDPDFDDGFKNGLHGLMGYARKDKLPGDAAGSISAWAYGLSCIMDYLDTDREVNKEKIILLGHSRLGKAALWAGAQDERFSMVISNDSGCGGAALSLRQHGETVAAINETFPHWFCDNFLKYNNKEEDLPVDQHMLLALIAPRPLYVASAKEDDWADPYGEQLSAHLASKVYALYGLDTQLTGEPVIENFPVKEGYIGYHLRSGPHDIRGYDWEQYLDFADYHGFRK